MKGQKILFSSKSDDWATPPTLFAELNKEFHFDLDPCPINAKHNALADQYTWQGNCFINPPYSNQRAFIEKGLAEKKLGYAKILVYLLPARTDTKLFHELIYNIAEIRFIKGRLKFGDQKNSAPFPSMIVIFK